MSEFFETSLVDLDKLKEGKRLILGYNPSRKLLLEYIKDRQFLVLESMGGKLKKGNKVEIHNIVKGFPLVCHKVIENDIDKGSYIGGKMGGLLYICILRND